MKNKGLPALVQLAILTLITTSVWVSFEVFRAFTKVPNIDVPAEVRAPLVPTLNQVALDRLVNRVYLEDEEIGDTVLEGQINAPEQELLVEEEIQDSTESAQNI